MPNKVVTTNVGGLRENPTGQFMLGSTLQAETVQATVAETIPTGYQLMVYGALTVAGSVDVQGKLVLL